LQNVEYRKPLTVWGELWIIVKKIFAASGVAGFGDSAQIYVIGRNKTLNEAFNMQNYTPNNQVPSKKENFSSKTWLTNWS
jgi:hypothetical protein